MALYFANPDGRPLQSLEPTDFGTVVATAMAAVLALCFAIRGGRASPTSTDFATAVEAVLVVTFFRNQEDPASPDSASSTVCSTMCSRVHSSGITLITSRFSPASSCVARRCQSATQRAARPHCARMGTVGASSRRRIGMHPSEKGDGGKIETLSLEPLEPVCLRLLTMFFFFSFML